MPVEDNVRYADTYLIEVVDKNKPSYKIKDGTKFIGYGAFSGCKALVAINIPSTVKKIDNYAFYGNDALSYVIVNWIIPFPIPANTFSSSTYSNARLLDSHPSAYGNSQTSRYSSIDGWKQFSRSEHLFVAGGLTMVNTDITAIIGEDIRLTTIINDKPYSSYATSIWELNWTSSDESIASVASQGGEQVILNNRFERVAYGLVVPHRPGKVTITATTIDGSNISASCEINVKYPYSLYINDQKCLAGSMPTIPIYMDNVNEISNLQFDVSLPEGIDIHYGEYADEEEGYFVSKGDRAKTSHTVLVKKLGNRNYRILISSSSNTVFKDTDKSQPVAGMVLDVSRDLVQGDYEIKISNAMLASYVNGVTTPIEVVDTTMTLTVPPPYSIIATAANEKMGNVTVKGGHYNDKTKTSIYGDEITITAVPAIGYSFNKWEENSVFVSTDNPYIFVASSNRNIKAIFTPNKYVVTFKVDGKIYSSSQQTFGDVVTWPSDPSKIGYSFKGWKNLISSTTVPANDVTYEAIFEINKYNVRFIADGVDIYNQKQTYGSMINVPRAPVKAGYVFITWGNVATTVPASDVTYIAEYALLGDTYEDNIINVADLTKLVGIILGSSSELTDRQLKIADVYPDNQINVADYTSLVPLILNSVSRAKARVQDDDFICKPKLNAYYINNSINIDIENTSKMTALQLDLILPSGCSVSDIIPISGFDKHAVYSKTNEDGSVRVVICSAMNEVIKKQNSIAIDLLHDANTANEDEIVITNIIGATYNSCVRMDDVVVDVNDETTALNGVYSNDDWSLQACNGYVNISSSKEQTITIFNSNGILVNKFVLGNGETKTITLSKGLYIINGKKLIVKF